MVDAVDSKVEVQMDGSDLTSLTSWCLWSDKDAFNHQPQQSLLFICIHRHQLVLYVYQQMMQSVRIYWRSVVLRNPCFNGFKTLLKLFMLRMNFHKLRLQNGYKIRVIHQVILELL